MPNCRLKKIYTKAYQDYISYEINDKVSWEQMVQCVADFYPLGIYSNNNLIKFFEEFINDNDLLGVLLEAKNKEHLETQIKHIFEKIFPEPNRENDLDIVSALKINDHQKREIKEIMDKENITNFTSNTQEDLLTPLYDIFKSPKYHNKKTNLDHRIKISLSRIYEFHKWFTTTNRDSIELEKLMMNFIDDIGIADELK